MYWLRIKLRDLGRNGLKIIQNWWIEILAIIFLISVIILIWVGYIRFTTGGWPDWTGFVAKILWNLTQLLIVPAVLAVGAYLLNESARKREQDIAEQNRQETALQTYLDRMAELLIKEKLRESGRGSEIRAVAQAQTLTMLRRLDKDRKGVLLRFLHEAKLIGRDKRVIDLSEANLIGAILIGAILRGARLRKVYLSGVNLSEADLRGADLRGADLSEADLSKASMWNANLIKANLTRANLRGTDLSKAILREADLIYANLSGTILSGADLSKADLRGVDLSEAILRGANYTKNHKYISDTIWPEGFDPDAAGAKRENQIKLIFKPIT